MNSDEGWVTGPALELVITLKAIERGDEVVIREMDQEWLDKMEMDPLTEAADGSYCYDTPYVVTEVTWGNPSEKCPIEIGETSINPEEIAAWRRPCKTTG